MRICILFLWAFLIWSCTKDHAATDPLEKALASDHPKIRRVMDSVDRYEVQIKYTQIDRLKDSIIFTDFDFQVHDSVYFYPASTVKLPIAVLALKKLHQTDSLNVLTKYYVEGDTIESTVAQDISAIFAVSDNLANNRLFELLGQNAINSSLSQKNIGPVRISHRLGYHSEDLRTKPLVVYLNDSTTGMTVPSYNTNPEPLKLQNIKKGIGYMANGKQIDEPFDFSLKNYLPISSLHSILKRIIFPEQFDPKEQFHISEQQRELLLNAMSTVPRKVGYDQNTFHDGYCKFFMYGDSDEEIPTSLNIYNKVGFAYGTVTDCAYIKDTANNVEFLLTATLLVNEDGIFNNDHYEFNEIGIPFLAQLGREIYDLELKRKQ
ncbi:class A beta-lactamase-related serine hydrolase [Maribacter sp. MAR_2009_72]|uniref:class A beta-lactamase-related serine hydrolase n=1 Tax=Maribacter sp. MAR_2009_72 TaxID=1250050 RepID=UPI00119AD61E|nr:class A beta-lactamase-related serine hydrolase [Maribacter sp. MAR_2009_72]TVZ17289.1 beta-lactamase family protein [Maribacter sp. MAR_2009_72]